MWRIVLAMVLACSAPTKSPTKPPVRNIGVVEGVAIDPRTGERLPGVEVMVSGACRAGEEVGWTITDEHGRYRIELEPGVCEVWAWFANAEVQRDVVVERGRKARLDLELAHEALVRARNEIEPLNCPSSKPKAIVEGHTTAQRDLDDVARAVLERFARDHGTIWDAAYLDTPVRVDVEVPGSRVSDPKRRLSVQAVLTFVANTRAELQAEANRRRANLHFVKFYGIDSDGTCAIVQVGTSVVQPSTSHAYTCTCTGTDVYEKRDGVWTFVRQAHASCG